MQCDLRTGECSQCHRARLTCYGYRDISELCFRDETFTTAQKALARHASTLRPTAAPQLTWDELSRNVFLSLYVVKLSHSFDALGPLLAKSPVNGHLHASVGAASLAFMAFHHGDPSLMPLANRRYLGAVQSLGLGLRNSQHSASDEILQSVLLLDLYEKIANRNAQQPASWMSHAQGALSVVKSRASNDFSSPITCQLANRVATAVIISAGAAASLVPDTLGPLRKALGRYVRGSKWNFMNLMVGVVNLRADMRSAASSLAGSADHLRRAKELDTQLALVESNTSRSWRPRRVFAMTHEPLVFGYGSLSP